MPAFARLERTIPSSTPIPEPRHCLPMRVSRLGFAPGRVPFCLAHSVACLVCRFLFWDLALLHLARLSLVSLSWSLQAPFFAMRCVISLISTFSSLQTVSDSLLPLRAKRKSSTLRFPFPSSGISQDPWQMQDLSPQKSFGLKPCFPGSSNWKLLRLADHSFPINSATITPAAPDKEHGI